MKNWKVITLLELEPMVGNMQTSKLQTWNFVDSEANYIVNYKYENQWEFVTAYYMISRVHN